MHFSPHRKRVAAMATENDPTPTEYYRVVRHPRPAAGDRVPGRGAAGRPAARGALLGQGLGDARLPAGRPGAAPAVVHDPERAVRHPRGQVRQVLCRAVERQFICGGACNKCSPGRCGPSRSEEAFLVGCVPSCVPIGSTALRRSAPRKRCYHPSAIRPARAELCDDGGLSGGATERRRRSPPPEFDRSSGRGAIAARGLLEGKLHGLS